MHRCLQLAALGAGNVAPNPMVGAVLVFEDRIIAEGYHQQYGGPHAEVNCINSVAPHHTDLIAKSTLYVSLEPCAHFGKTPPCADLIIQHKIPTVIVACSDTYKEVNGKGIEKLRTAGVNVEVGILEKEAFELNKHFFLVQLRQRPYIILKWAQSDDRKVAFQQFNAVAISNSSSNKLVHRWRSEASAIMVGTNTALYDNPKLNNRLWTGKNPVRVVLDMNLRLPLSLNVFDESVPTIIFNSQKNNITGNVTYSKLDYSKKLLPQLLDQLFHLNIQSLLVEGGSTLLQSFINEGCWDEARVITNKFLIMGEGIDAPTLKKQLLSKEENLLNDCIQYYNNSILW